MVGVLCLAAFALAALLVALSARPVGPVDGLLFFAPTLTGFILLAGYALSALNLLSSVYAWTGASVVALALAAAWWWLATRPTQTALLGAPAAFAARMRLLWATTRREYGNLGRFEKRLLMPCLATVALLALVNLDLVLNTAPHNWDSMTYHLARMAYYLQHGNLANFDANYWAQVTHPKNSTVLVLFTYLVSGRNENLTQLVQFLSYCIASVSVYGISRRIGASRYAGLFAAAVFALLIECLMQAITTQNDMLVTALTGCAVYGLFAYRERGARRYLVLTAAATAMALGVKSSAALVLPPLAVVAVYALIERRRIARALSQPDLKTHRIIGDFSVLLGSGIAAAALFTLPAGYAENWLVYGHPIGPEYVRKLHSFEGRPLGYVLENGTLNLLRFGFEFLSLDGLPPFGDIANAQSWLRQGPRDLTLAAGLDLETTEATRAPFIYAKQPVAHEDGSYWGILGFGLVWPAVFLVLIGAIKSAPGRVLSIAALLFWVLQAYSGPYDPWRGRYFIIAAVFAAPVLSVWIGRPHAWPVRMYLAVIVLVGCFSGVAAVLGRANSSPEQVYRLDRLGQLTRNRGNYTDAIRRFEELVPADATVATYFGEDTFEYPLFGKGLTRKLVPVNGFFSGPRPAPPEAGYLVYSEALYPNADRRATDIHLGEDWYLRVLLPAQPTQNGGS